MFVIDNFFPNYLIDSVIEESKEYSWNFSRTDKNDDKYWTIHIFGNVFLENGELSTSNFKFQEIKKCWEFIKNKFNGLVTDKNLSSCYLNGLTNGLEAHPHIDRTNVTIICYICPLWNSHWGGETCFYDREYSTDPSDEVFYTHEIIKSVLPRYNRVVIFDGNIVHSVKPLSKTFKGLRQTLMFKLVDLDTKDLNLNAT
jgi:hypothetical protein